MPLSVKNEMSFHGSYARLAKLVTVPFADEFSELLVISFRLKATELIVATVDDYTVYWNSISFKITDHVIYPPPKLRRGE